MQLKIVIKIEHLQMSQYRLSYYTNNQSMNFVKLR